MKCAIAFALFVSPALADGPVIEDVQIDGDRVSVTLSHPDTGWDHYADGWEVLDADGNSLGVRELLHPHVAEQPFTRSLSYVQVPQGATAIYVRARCNVDGWSEDLFQVLLAE